MDGASLDIAAINRAQLKALFPAVFTEARNDKGELVESVDFERLKAELGTFTDLFESRRERYGMDWPGKRDALKLIQTPTYATLEPARDESVNFDTTDNLFIEGDNLEVLKLLQKSYYGKVKMVYIDPPYNTGGDFIYPDNFTETLETYLQYTAQVDAAGKKLGTNTDTGGRFHTKWLNMIYPRLYLARNLLRDDGVIFASIDDGEFENLRRVMADVFGEENFLATFVWKRKAGGGDDSGHIAAEHEYVICFAKDSGHAGIASVIHESPSMTAKYNKSENGKRYYLERLDKTSLTYNKSMDFPIECPDGSFVSPPQPDPSNPTTSWRWGRDTVKERRSELIFDKDKKTGEWKVYTKTWEPTDGVTPRSLMVEKEHGRNRDGTQELSDIIGPKVFNNPKPTRMLRHLLEIGAKDKDSVVVDFFAGSGSLAHALMDMNDADDGNRRFILIQLPEHTERSDYPTIADICRARLRKVIEAKNKASAQKLSLNSGVGSVHGFRSFKLAASNFKRWIAPPKSDAEALAAQLELHIQHIATGSVGENLLFELLIKSGFTPTERVTVQKLAEIDVYSVADGGLLICLADKITRDLIDAVAAAEPLQFVCLDSAFTGNDQLKANAVQTFAARNQGRDKTSQIVFRTV